MKYFKLAIISFIVFFLLITSFSLLVPSHVRISRAIEVREDGEEVMQLLTNPAQWKNWYPAAAKASLLYIHGELKGITTGKGQRVTITSSTDSSMLAILSGPRSKTAKMGWNLFPGRETGRITVQWYMDFRLRWYPWEKFSSLLFDKQYGSFMEDGLARIKKLVENY